VTDLSGAEADFRSLYGSRTDNATGYLLTSETMEFFRDAYTPDAERRAEPDASPMLTEDVRGLAPALVLTAEFDPLRDEGEAYAARLADGGVETTLTRYDGAIHMFFQMTDTAIGARALAEVAAALRDRLA
jgi:acetyl esterase